MTEHIINSNPSSRITYCVPPKYPRPPRPFNNGRRNKNMTYKEKMKLVEATVINNDVDSYFKDLGFKVKTMSPKYKDDRTDFDLLTLGVPALTHEYIDEELYYIRVYINSEAIYIERETPWGNLSSTSFCRFEKNGELTIEKIEKELEYLV